MAGLDPLSNCTGSQWDEHNAAKNWERHRVTPWECEEVFLGAPVWVAEDRKHSEREARFYALGQTRAGRLLMVVFTVRGSLIRVISARDMSRKEGEVYAGL